LRGDFGPLKRKLLLRAFAVAAIVFGLGFLIRVLLIDGILEAPFADAFIRVYQALFDADWREAATVYRRLLRDNKSEFLMAGLLLMATISFYASLSTLIRYFRELGEGIHRLADESAEEIRLSPETAFLERKLNEAKRGLRRRADDLKEAERRKDELVLYLAHDIRTPLTSVIGYLSLLRDSPGLPAAEREKYVNIALDKANGLEALVEEFFEITRFGNRAVALEKEKLDLSYMLMQLADEFYPKAAAAGKRIELRATEDLNVTADPDKLARVFNNLLKNALAYSSDDSVIEIEAYERAGAAFVVFRNQGATIPRSALGAIFDKHYRQGAARGSGGGAGLGLAIAKEIVELHGGEIGVRSDARGTAFTVRLPEADPSPCTQ
jgi:two-component system sensor histidine kinase VanS